MKKGKIFLIILIPIVIALLAVAGIFTYLELNSSPKKIFETAISKTIDELKEKQTDYKTVKEKIELSAKIESDEESLKETSQALEKSKIVLESELDTENLFLNGSAKVVYNDESLVNANMLIQDEKMYIALTDWFAKYIEIPGEEYDFEELKEGFESINSVDKKMFLESVKQELINVLEKQSYTKERAKLELENGETSVIKSSLKLNNKQMELLTRELLANLKTNKNFQESLGTSKEMVLNNIDEILNNESANELEENETVTFAIYTKGFANEFVGFDIITKDEYEESGLAFVKKSKTKYEGYMYKNVGEEKNNIAKITWEKNDTDGTIKVLIPSEDEETEITCKYKKNNNQISYDIETEMDEGKLSIYGSVTKENTKYSGNAIISIEVPEFGKITTSALYSIEYNASIQRVDVSNSVKMNEMTEEEQQKLMTNVQNSKLYTLISQVTANNALFNYAMEAAGNNAQGLNSSDSVIKVDNYSVRYNVPNGLKYINYSTESQRIYTDDELSTVIISIEKENADDYLESLSNNYILTSSIYSDQSITDVLDYEMGNKTFKYRGITYKDTLGEYLKLFFTYQLSDDYLYVVDATIEGDSLSLDQITEFLNIEITKEDTTI